MKIGTLILTAVCVLFASSAAVNAQGFKSPFPGKDAIPVRKQGATEQEAAKQYDEALRSLSKLTFLSENDSRHYSRNIQSILGYYAHVNQDGNLVLNGGSKATGDQKIALKDAIVFNAVVKSGFDAAVKIPIISFGLKKSEVAELRIQDIATITSRINLDLVACRFPFSLRDKAIPKGDTQFYYVSAVTVMTMTTKRFKSTGGEASGLLSILSFSGKKYYSSEAEEIKYLVSVAISPVSPLDIDTCKLVAEQAKDVPPAVAGLESVGEAAPDVAASLAGQVNVEALQGKIVNVIEALN